MDPGGHMSVYIIRLSPFNSYFENLPWMAHTYNNLVTMVGGSISFRECSVILNKGTTNEEHVRKHLYGNCLISEGLLKDPDRVGLQTADTGLWEDAQLGVLFLNYLTKQMLLHF